MAKCLCSYKNNILKIQYSEPYEFSSYSRVILELFVCKVCIFLKQQAILFNVFHCFCMFVKNILHISHKVKSVIMRNLRDLLYMKTNVLQDFNICISVPLNTICYCLIFFYSYLKWLFALIDFLYTWSFIRSFILCFSFILYTILHMIACTRGKQPSRSIL